jgi:hypothetical protein
MSLIAKITSKLKARAEEVRKIEEAQNNMLNDALELIRFRAEEASRVRGYTVYHVMADGTEVYVGVLRANPEQCRMYMQRMEQVGIMAVVRR